MQPLDLLNPGTVALGTGSTVALIAAIGTALKLLLTWLDKRDERIFATFATKLNEHSQSFVAVNESLIITHQLLVGMQKWLLLHDQRTNDKSISTNDALYQSMLQDNARIEDSLARILDSYRQQHTSQR